jgi:hypothetical protein
MTVPDPLSVRAYHLSVKNHRQEADRSLRYIREQAAQMDTAAAAEALSLAQRLAVDLSHLTARLGMLKALDEMSFLTADPDAKEA